MPRSNGDRTSPRDRVRNGKVENNRDSVAAEVRVAPAPEGDVFAAFIEWADDADEIAYRDL